MQRRLVIISQLNLEKLPHVKEVRHQGLLAASLGGVEFDDTISGVDV